MKRIIILTMITLGMYSCSDVHKNECKLISLEKKYNKNQENPIIDLSYNINKKTIELSVLNLRKDSVVFTLPKLNFVLMEPNNKASNDNIVIKPYISYVYINKSISYIRNNSNTKVISTDFTMQRNEKYLPVKIGFKEKFIKELYIDCKKSDIGNYMIYFLTKNDPKNDKVIQIQYPQNAILRIKN